MSNIDTVGIAQDAMVLSLTPKQTQTASPAKDQDNMPCDMADKECMSRWIAAFSDCDQ
jgi:hypothetical protein